MDLAKIAYPETEIEHKHLVAVRRTMKRLVPELDLKTIRDGQRPRGWNLSFRLPLPAELEKMETLRIAGEIRQLMQDISSKRTTD